jgi:hypothetical protein
MKATSQESPAYKKLEAARLLKSKGKLVVECDDEDAVSLLEVAKHECRDAVPELMRGIRTSRT